MFFWYGLYKCSGYDHDCCIDKKGDEVEVDAEDLEYWEEVVGVDG